MYSCSRNCLRPKVNNHAVARRHSPANAPLLFLYPAWYQRHVRQLHYAAEKSERACDISRSRERRLGGQEHHEIRAKRFQTVQEAQRVGPKHLAESERKTLLTRLGSKRALRRARAASLQRDLPLSEIIERHPERWSEGKDSWSVLSGQPRPIASSNTGSTQSDLPPALKVLDLSNDLPVPAPGQMTSTDNLVDVTASISLSETSQSFLNTPRALEIPPPQKDIWHLFDLSNDVSVPAQTRTILIDESVDITASVPESDSLDVLRVGPLLKETFQPLSNTWPLFDSSNAESVPAIAHGPSRPNHAELHGSSKHSNQSDSPKIAMTALETDLAREETRRPSISHGVEALRALNDEKEDTEPRRYSFNPPAARKHWNRIYTEDIPDESAMKRSFRLRKLAMKYKYSPEGRNWTIPLRSLAAATRKPIPLAGEKLKLDSLTIYELTGSFDENVWTNHVRSGCEVHILHRSNPGVHTQHTVLLRGQERARELTKESLLNFQESHIRPVRWIKAGDDVPNIHYQFSQMKHHSRVRSYRRAEDLPKPESWTVRLFADYVEDLVAMRIPRTYRRELYEPEKAHNQSVATILESLFTDPDCKPFISTRALNYAMSFACKHTELTSTLVNLYAMSKSWGIHLPIEIFNLMVESTLRLRQSSHFTSILKDMGEMNVAPNGATWAKLLAIVRNQDARLHVLAYMQASDLLKSREAVDAVALELVRTDFLNFAGREGGLEEFFSSMDDLLGNHWLSTRAMNRMLHICAERSQWELAATVVSMSIQRNVRFKSTTVTYQFKLAQKLGYLRESLDILESHFVQIVGWDETFVIPAIFKTAWKQGFFNVCRVLWHYAGTRGIISYAMQSVVMGSLINNTGLDNSSRHRSRYSVAGKLIIGTDNDSAYIESISPLWTSQTGVCDRRLRLACWTSNDGTREEQLSLAGSIMRRDLTAWKRYEPMNREYFFGILRKSFDKDYSWIIGNVLNTTSFSNLLTDVIQVQLKPADVVKEKPFDVPVSAVSLSTGPSRDQSAEQPPLITERDKLNESSKIYIHPTVSPHVSQTPSKALHWRSTSTSLKHLTSSLHIRAGSGSPFTQRRGIATHKKDTSPRTSDATGLDGLPFPGRIYRSDPTRMQTFKRISDAEGSDGLASPIRVYTTEKPKRRNISRISDAKGSDGLPSPIRVYTSDPPPGFFQKGNRVCWFGSQKFPRKTPLTNGLLPPVPRRKDPPSRVEKLRLRSALLTWNTSNAQIRVLKMLDQRDLRTTISARSNVARSWYRLHEQSNLLNHIKESYELKPILDLERFEDLTALKYACARLIYRGREIYLRLLPEASQYDKSVRRLVGQQSENVHRLEQLIEPFYNEWAATKARETLLAPDFKSFLHGKEMEFRSVWRQDHDGHKGGTELSNDQVGFSRSETNIWLGLLEERERPVQLPAHGTAVSET